MFVPCLLLAALPQTPAGGFGLRFEENGGRFDPEVRFVARAGGATLFLTADALWTSFDASTPEGEVRAALRMTFEGAAPAALEGEVELPTRVHYFLGDDPAGWSTDNRTFERVRWSTAWPGIDVLGYERAGHLELDFVVAPGADPDAIRLRFDGLSDNAVPAVNGRGELVLPTLAGDVLQTRPVLYQERGGARVPVTGAFALRDPDTVGFRVGVYDRTLPLVIDPILVFSTYLGGDDDDVLTDAAADADGSVVVAGFTQSIDFPATPGAYQVLPGDLPVQYDAVVARVSPAGDALSWCTYLGGATTFFGSDAGDFAFAVDVDATGVYVGGRTTSVDFPDTPGTAIGDGFYSDTGFVTKLAPGGDALVWSSYFEGHAVLVHGLEADGAGNVYAAGEAAQGVLTTPGAFDTTGHVFPGRNGFVCKIAPDASDYVWCSYFEGATSYISGNKPVTRILDVATDSSGRVFVGGTTDAVDLPTVGGLQPTHVGKADGFLAVFAPDGASLAYSSYLGGSDSEDMLAEYGVACDDSGGAWFVATSRSSDYPTTPGALQETDPDPAARTGVVTRLDTTQVGSASLLWSTYLGGSSGDDFLTNVELDAAGNAVLTGVVKSPDFPTLDPLQPCNSGASDAVLTVLDPTGALVSSTFFGGSATEPLGGAVHQPVHGGMALDPASGDAWLVGATTSLDLPVSAGAFQPGAPLDFGTTTAASSFVARFSPPVPPAASHAVRPGCLGTLPPGSLVPVSAGPVVGQPYSFAIDDPTDVSGMPAGSTAWWVVSALPAIPGSPCGLAFPGWGVGGADGEVLVNFNGSNPLFGPVLWGGPGVPATFIVPIPCKATYLGVPLYTQGVLFDGVDRFVLTEGLDLVLGI